MGILSIIGVSVIAAVLCILLRQYRPEYALLVSLAAGFFILFAAFSSMGPVVEQVRAMLDSVSMPGEYAAVLFKALGICFVTQLACDTCRDAGETAISTKVEIAGKLAVLVATLPLFRQVLEVVQTLIW